jgi:DNA-binding NarL/FixJ family response regulator
LPVAVWTPVPTYRRGLVAVLADAGFDLEEPDELDAWVMGGGRRAVVVSGCGSEGLAALRELNSDLAIVALLEDASPDGYRGALQAGASAAVPWDAPPTIIVEVVRAAFDDQTLFPVPVAQALASTASIGLVPPDLSAIEVGWLRKLAKGMTVSDLAKDVGCSSREMFRLLRSLYVKMGVRNRREALFEAARWGLPDL